MHVIREAGLCAHLQRMRFLANPVERQTNATRSRRVLMRAGSGCTLSGEAITDTAD